MRKLSAMQFYLNVGARGFDLWECTYHTRYRVLSLTTWLVLTPMHGYIEVLLMLEGDQ
jgi:hypothetical protein